MSKILDFNHPAYFGLANTLPDTDKRLEDFKTQFNIEGFDSTYLWSLDTTIAKIVGKLLVEFSEFTISRNSGDSSEPWKTIEEGDNLAIWKDKCRTHGENLLKYVEPNNYQLSNQELAQVHENVIKALDFLKNNFFDLWD